MYLTLTRLDASRSAVFQYQLITCFLIKPKMSEHLVFLSFILFISEHLVLLSFIPFISENLVCCLLFLSSLSI